MVIIFLAGILFTAFGVMGWLFYQMHSTSLLAQERLAIPVESLEATPFLAPVAASGSKVPEPQVSFPAKAAGQDQEQVDHWRAENAAFQAQLQELSIEVQQLKGLLSRLEEENARLKSESEGLVGTRGLVQQAKREYQRQLEGFFKEIGELNEDNRLLRDQVVAGDDLQQLRRAEDELSARVRELEIYNAAQSEKNEYLQYELTKSRAQVVGLERLCEQIPVAG